MNINKFYVLIIKLPDKCLRKFTNHYVNTIRNVSENNLRQNVTLQPSNISIIKCQSSKRSYSASNKTFNWLSELKTEKGGDDLWDMKKRQEMQKINPNIINDSHYYYEKVVIGYSRQQMCDLVFDVDKYREFVPFCIDSEVIKEYSTRSSGLNLNLAKSGLNLNKLKTTPIIKTVNKEVKNDRQTFRAKLQIGYPPIREAYVSHVEMVQPELVRAISRDTRLFEFMLNEWKFHPYDSEKNSSLNLNLGNSSSSDMQIKVAQGYENCCLIEFYVSFKFKSILYTKIAPLFIESVSKKMVVAFTKRAAEKYGKASMEPVLLTRNLE